ncbi:MAG: 23S rRNA (adenine(2503)-C(2))-methyltransferase RlmN [Bacteroidota bacterium]|nr:23S rRNA (adenine(2503)-C(2))-methyltransferase RlmN [Bacteroidota bacterium]
MENLKDIRSLTQEELTGVFKTMGEPAFRAKQVYQWLWQKSAISFGEMTNLSKDTRAKLENGFEISPVTISEMQISGDRTIKCAMKLQDNKIVESVLIPTDTRMTVCISSQVGCSLTCKFCATGRLKRLRNLTAGEIYDQVALVKKLSEEKYGQPLTNIVYMGMGEPLLNYKEVINSVNHITSQNGLGMAAKRITVSTAGVAKMIQALGDDDVKFNLALSLHAADDEKRNHIMPINETNTLDNLADAMNYYYNKTGNKVTFEYIAFKDFNDSLQDAKDLAKFCARVPSKVNIIEYNPIDDGEFQQTTPERLNTFFRYLADKGVVVNVRRSRGKDIDAACGQLANKNKVASPILKA